jgi:hypothetical protein
LTRLHKVEDLLEGFDLSEGCGRIYRGLRCSQRRDRRCQLVRVLQHFRDPGFAGTDRSFVGTLDQVMDDVRTAADAGADELIVDLNLQDWFTSTWQMLETAVEIRERCEWCDSPRSTPAE